MGASTRFLDDICSYIGDKTDFYYGDADVLPGGKNSWLKAGELPKDTNGVYAMQIPTEAPDRETGVMDFRIDFWALNQSTADGYADLQKIYDLFYLNHDFPTDNFYVFQSFMEGQAEDWDRTIDNLKALSLSAIFYVRYLIS